MTDVNISVNGTNLLTHSRTRSFRKCNRKHLYEYEIGIRPETDAKPLRMGGALHLANHLHREGASRAVATFDGTAIYAEIPPWAEAPVTQEAWLVEGETMRRLIWGYFWRWAGDHIDIIEAEQAVVMPIINPDTGAKSTNWMMACKIDGIGKLADGRLAVIETKTCSEDISLESDYWRMLKIDHQVSIEILAARHAGHDVVTCLYDVIRKPGIKPKLLSKKAKQDIVATGMYYGEPVVNFNPAGGDPRNIPDRETAAMYGARLAHDIGERPDYYYARVEIPRLEADLLEFRYDLWDQQKAIRAAQQRNLWARNSDSCNSYGKCPFFDKICAQGLRIMPEDPTPTGYRKLEFIHPELEEDLVKDTA